MADETLDLLRRLTTAPGPPGSEGPVRDIVRSEIGSLGDIRHDRLGSLLCELPGPSRSPRVMLDCHLDEVGFMVQKIDPAGWLAFVPLGGWWSHTLLGQRVTVLTGGGAVDGVVGSTPPHFLSAADRERVLPIESLFIDVGTVSAEETAALGVRVGDAVAPAASFVELGPPGTLSAKALDNRAGVTVMCRALQSLARSGHPNTVIGVAAVQEEVGLRGAGTAARLANPDVALVLECAPADDLPGETQPQGAIGKGPQIRHFDPTAISNRRLVALVERVADEVGVPLQLAVRRTGGTDAGAIHKSGHGVPTVVIGVPARYIHSHAGIVRLSDVEAAVTLTAACVRALDEAAVGALTGF